MVALAVVSRLLLQFLLVLFRALDRDWEEPSWMKWTTRTVLRGGGVRKRTVGVKKVVVVTDDEEVG